MQSDFVLNFTFARVEIYYNKFLFWIMIQCEIIYSSFSMNYTIKLSNLCDVILVYTLQTVIDFDSLYVINCLSAKKHNHASYKKSVTIVS